MWAPWNFDKIIQITVSKLQFAVIIYGLLGVVLGKAKILASVISHYEMIPLKAETNDYPRLNEQTLSNSPPIQNNKKFKKNYFFWIQRQKDNEHSLQIQRLEIHYSV